jgi:eukaryotic-like serine/threonine-protein kinase
VLSTCLERNPDQFPLLLLRSRAYRRLNQITEANRDREYAMSIPNLRGNALVLRAQARLNAVPPDLEGALVDLEAADKFAPSTPSIMRKLAYAHVRLGDANKAVEILEKVRDREPDNESAISYLAVLLARQGRNTEAIERLNQALIEPNRPSVLYQAACVHALLPDKSSHVQAIKYLSSAIQRGYGAGVIDEDEDLNSLREMPGFQAILRTTQLGKPPRQEDEPTDPIEEFSNSEL